MLPSHKDDKNPTCQIITVIVHLFAAHCGDEAYGYARVPPQGSSCSSRVNLQHALQVPCSAEYMESGQWRFCTQKLGSTTYVKPLHLQICGCRFAINRKAVPWQKSFLRVTAGLTAVGIFVAAQLESVCKMRATKASAHLWDPCSTCALRPRHRHLSWLCLPLFSLCVFGPADFHWRRRHLLAACRTVPESKPSTGIAVMCHSSQRSELRLHDMMPGPDAESPWTLSIAAIPHFGW